MNLVTLLDVIPGFKIPIGTKGIIIRPLHNGEAMVAFGGDITLQLKPTQFKPLPQQDFGGTVSSNK